MDRRNNKRKGFTLIELLLVLVILASLAAIVVPRFANQSQKAKLTQAATQITGFETALDTFELAMGRYPTEMEGLEALIRRPSGLNNNQDWEPFLKKQSIPLDPWGNEYQYRYPGQENEYGYDLFSFGPDGKEGGDDDIDNWSTGQDN